ncbi:MAG: NAD(+) diphosphatase [Actinomycetales bacterium]|nr:NAD(+) diphosphatase [Actinomycetales bacterium]
MSTPFSSRLPLSRVAIDRDHRARDRPLEELLAEPDARLVVLHDARVLLADGRRLARLDPTAASVWSVAMVLGRDRELGDPSTAPAGAVVAVVVDDATAAALPAAVGPEARWVSLREAGELLDDRDAALATQALALANWHAVTGFSARTGEPLGVARGGWVLTEADGREHFPRTDAAIIVAVTDADDRLLLGSHVAWDADRFSLLAGFVEPGESLEQAVIREVLEESGIVVENPEYRGSQPWPFPASLMIGFHARIAPAQPPSAWPEAAEATAPGATAAGATDAGATDAAADPGVPDGEEIRELRWFTRDGLAADITAGRVRPPGGISISRALIEDWFGGPLPDPEAPR